MKTLTVNSEANYLKAGIVPRLFVSIPDADLFLGTQAFTDGDNVYTDSMKRNGTITQSVEPFGGAGVVSGVDISNLEIGETLSLCTTLDVNPLGTIPEPYGAGRIVSAGNPGEPGQLYSDIRGANSGIFSNSSVTIGQLAYLDGIDTYYNVYRGFVQFEIPDDLSTCEDATLEFYGSDDRAETDFQIYVIEGLWLIWPLGSMFDDFTGWESGDTAYDSTEATGSPVLNEDWHTSLIEVSETEPNYIRLNLTGRELIESKHGSTLELILISKRDFDGTEPTGEEFVRFKSSDVTLKLRYNTNNLFNQEASIYLAFASAGNSLADLSTVTDMQQIWTGVIDDYVINERTLDLRLRQNNFKKDAYVNQNIITSDNFTSCPEDNIGKPYSVVIGDVSESAYGLHLLGIGQELVGGLINPVSGLHRYLSCFVINEGTNDYDTAMELIVSNRAIKDSITTWPAVWIDSLRCFGRFWANISGDLGTTYRYVKAYPMKRVEGDFFGAGDYAYQDFMGVTVSVIPAYVYDYSEFENPEYAFSSDPAQFVTFDSGSGYVTLGFNSIGGGGEIDKAEIVFEQVQNTGIYAMEVSLYEKPETLDVEGTDGVSFYSAPNQQFSSATSTFQTDGVQAGDMVVILDETNRGRYRITNVNSETVLILLDQMSNATGQTFKIISAPTNLLDYEDVFTGDGQRVFDVTTSISWGVENFLIKFKLAGPANYTLQMVQLRIFMTADEKITKVWFDKEGIKDDASGTITGTASRLLDNPAHILEGIVTNELNYVNAEINTSDLDAMATELGSLGANMWKFCFQLDERIRALEFFDNFGKQSKSVITYDEENKLSGKAFDKNAGFPNAGTETENVPGDLDIFDEDAAVTDGAFTTHPILNPEFSGGNIIPFEIRHMGMDKVMNDFVLRYKKNYATGDFEEVLYMTNGEGVENDVSTNMTEANLENNQTLSGTGGLKQLCADSYNLISSTNTWDFEAEYVRDEATANKLLQHYIERLTTNRKIVRFTTGINGLAHDLGDFINIRHHRLEDLLGTPAMEAKRWMITNIDSDMDTYNITFEAIEV